MIKLDAPPTIKEASIIADILDKEGAYCDAELMDEYIKKSLLFNGDFIKMAGLWADIWSRMAGGAKRIFVREFREAYDAAKNLQQQLEDRLIKINEKFDYISTDLKNYRLDDWYQKIINFPISQDLIKKSGFVEKYGNFMQAILGVNKAPKGQYDKDDILKIFNLPEIEDKKIEDKKIEDISEWSAVDRRNPSVEEYYQGDMIRIKIPFWNKWAQKHIKKYPKTEEGVVAFKIMPTIKDKEGNILQKTPSNLEEAMGDNFWVKEKSDNNYVYLKKIQDLGKPKQPLVEMEKPQAELKQIYSPEPMLGKLTPEEEEEMAQTKLYKNIENENKEKKYETRKIPKFERGKEFEFANIKNIEKDEKENISDDDFKKTVNEINQVDEIPPEEAIKKYFWVQYTSEAPKGLEGDYCLVKKIRKGIHKQIKNPNNIEYLNNLWLEKKKGVKTSRFKRIDRIIKLNKFINCNL